MGHATPKIRLMNFFSGENIIKLNQSGNDETSGWSESRALVKLFKYTWKSIEHGMDEKNEVSTNYLIEGRCCLGAVFYSIIP